EDIEIGGGTIFTVKRGGQVVATAKFRPKGEQRLLGKTDSDQQKLQGAWRGVGGFAMGEVIKTEDVRQCIVTFSGDTMETPPSPGNKGGKGTFVLDPSKTPKWITLTEKTGENVAKMQGVYGFLDDNTLRICMSDPKHGPITEFGGKVGLDITLRREAATVAPSESAGENVTANPRLLKTFASDSPIRALGYTGDGKSLVVAG